MSNETFYTSYSFDDMVANLQNRLSQKGAWQDIYRSAGGEMLIEVLSYILEQGLYYTERRAQESFLSTAQNRSSIVNLVSLINYSPKRKTSSQGNLIFTLDAILSEIVYIPKYTECQTGSGVKYITNESASIVKGQTTVTVSSIQGELVQKEIISDGSTSQEYLISDDSVENSSSTDNSTFRVIVDGVEWELVKSFLYADPDSQQYRIINEMEGTVSVRFGDGINGKAPISGTTILLQYVKTVGSEGNVSYGGKITTINSTIYDAVSAVITTVGVTNTGSFLGGDDEESAEEIRIEAPQVFKTGDRAVNKDDFISILTNYAGVADANVWGENEEATLAGTTADVEMLNKVKIAVILQNWALPDVTFQTTLAAYLYNLSMITVKYEFVLPSFLNVIPVLQVTVKTGNSLSQTTAEINAIVDAQLLLGTTTSMGVVLKYSQMLSAIHALDSVDHVTMTFEIKQSLSTSYNSVYDYGAGLNATAVEAGTVRLFVDDTYITTDVDNGDGTGDITSSSLYTVAGTITYATGVLNLDIGPFPTENIYVRYQQDEDGDIVPTFQQICKLDDSGVDMDTIEIATT